MGYSDWHVFNCDRSFLLEYHLFRTENVMEAEDEYGSILILGASGMIGSALQKILPHAIAMGDELDILHREAVISCIDRLHPAIVINAPTCPNGTCRDHDTMVLRFGAAPGYVAAACKKVDAAYVHYTTGDIFDGSENGYTEDAVPCPATAFGSALLQGEQNVMAATDDYHLIRTSWMFGPHEDDMVGRMLALSKEKGVVKEPYDQYGRPTYTLDLAVATVLVTPCDPGIYHLTNDGTCSRYEFARRFIPNVSPCSSKEYPGDGSQSGSSILLNTKIPPLRHWKEALDEYLVIRGIQLPIRGVDP
jgi:dTDP-4-dehydrorhamnose reductase